MLISLSLIVAASCQVEIPGGQCTPVPLMPNFELNKYAGLWYEQIKYPFRNSVELGGKCVTATYTGIDDISVSVNNSIIYPDENDQFYLSSVLGTGVQLEVCVVKISKIQGLTQLFLLSLKLLEISYMCALTRAGRATCQKPPIMLWTPTTKTTPSVCQPLHSFILIYYFV